VRAIEIVTVAANMGASSASDASYWRFGRFARIATKVSVIEVHPVVSVRRNLLHMAARL
jgi:hypothetical protein